MIFYLCNGNQLAGTQADAKALDRDFIQVDVPTDKAGLMAYINELMARLENSPEISNEPPPPPAPPASIPVSYTERAVSFEDAFENMPLALQLHFGAKAMENARSCLK